MALSDKLAFARKQKKIKQSDLHRVVGTFGDIIRKDENCEPVSLEIETKTPYA